VVAMRVRAPATRLMLSRHMSATTKGARPYTIVTSARDADVGRSPLILLFHDASIPSGLLKRALRRNLTHMAQSPVHALGGASLTVNDDLCCATRTILTRQIDAFLN